VRRFVLCLALLWPLTAARAQTPDPEPAPEPAPASDQPADQPATDQPAATTDQPATPAPALPEIPPSPGPTADKAPDDATPAPAKPEPTPAEAKTQAAPKPPRRFRAPKELKFGGSYTWAPLQLMLPMVELTGEMSLTPKHSLAIVLGVGWPTATTVPNNPFENPQSVQLRAINAGGQYRYYMLGDFDRGVSLGTEILMTDYSGQASDVTAATWSLLLGGKYAFPFGLTFDLQAGPGVRFGGGHAAELTPVYNANVGWSFVFHRKKKLADAEKKASGTAVPPEPSDHDGGFDLDDDGD